MVVSWGYSGLGHLWTLVVHPLPVLVDGSFLLMLLVGRSFLSFGSLLWGSSPSLSSWGFPASRMGWLSFFSFFVVISHLSGFVRTLFFMFSVIISLVYCVVASC